MFTAILADTGLYSYPMNTIHEYKDKMMTFHNDFQAFQIIDENCSLDLDEHEEKEDEMIHMDQTFVLYCIYHLSERDTHRDLEKSEEHMNRNKMMKDSLQDHLEEVFWKEQEGYRVPNHHGYHASNPFLVLVLVQEQVYELGVFLFPEKGLVQLEVGGTLDSEQENENGVKKKVVSLYEQKEKDINE